MQRFKAWLFTWLMGEHYNDLQRQIMTLGKIVSEHDDMLRDHQKSLDEVAKFGRCALPAPKKVIQSRNWADFQRLAGDSDAEVQ